jgi:hypothetical protein
MFELFNLAPKSWRGNISDILKPSAWEIVSEEVAALKTSQKCLTDRER